MPLRIEIGPKDLAKHQVTLVRRDGSPKTFVGDADVVTEVKRTLEDIQQTLFTRAKTALAESTSTAKDYDEFKRTLDERGGFIRAGWCGDSECEDAIKAESGATIRTIPLQDEETFAKCVRCSKPSAKTAYFANSY